MEKRELNMTPGQAQAILLGLTWIFIAGIWKSVEVLSWAGSLLARL